MTEWISEDEARLRLLRAVDAVGTISAYAVQAGCSPSLVSQVLSAAKPMGPTLAKALGLIAVPQKTYRYVAKEEA